MEDLIEEKIQEKFDMRKTRILVKYENIRKYEITIICRQLPIEKGLITKTIVFSYDWFNNFTFDSNIEQLYYEIKNLLEKENIKYDN